MKRILYDILILFGLVFLPWWVTIFLCILGVFLFDYFYEGIFAPLLMYGLYGVGSSGIFASQIYLPIILIIIFLTLQFLKKQFLFNKNDV